MRRRRLATGTMVRSRHAVEDPQPLADGERHDVEPQLVDEIGREVGVERAHPAGDRDVGVAGGVAGPLDGGIDPSVTKWKVVPPSISTGSRGRVPSTNTGAWYGGSGPHHPVHSGPIAPVGADMCRPIT